MIKLNLGKLPSLKLVVEVAKPTLEWVPGCLGLNFIQHQTGQTTLVSRYWSWGLYRVSNFDTHKIIMEMFYFNMTCCNSLKVVT